MRQVCSIIQRVRSLPPCARQPTRSMPNCSNVITTTGRGQYALGLLVLAVIRENQCTLLLSGSTHAVWVSDGQSRHIYEPALSGKGLGSSQSVSAYLSQLELHPQDLLDRKSVV